MDLRSLVFRAGVDEVALTWIQVEVVGILKSKHRVALVLLVDSEGDVVEGEVGADGEVVVG